MRWIRDDNIVAIHCKGGKGRTGLICSCLLLGMNIRSTPEEALQLFAQKRTNQDVIKDQEIEMTEVTDKSKDKSHGKVQAVSSK